MVTCLSDCVAFFPVPTFLHPAFPVVSLFHLRLWAGGKTDDIFRSSQSGPFSQPCVITHVFFSAHENRKERDSWGDKIFRPSGEALNIAQGSSRHLGMAS